MAKLKALITSDYANDGKQVPCFLTVKQSPWWYLELGANVRVSIVFIIHWNFAYFEGVDILVGECVL